MKFDHSLVQRFLSAALITFALATVAPVAQAADLNPPSTPVNVRAWWVEPDHIYLKWDAANDDVEVSTYRIYRNDELVATTIKTYFLDMEYDREIYNSYSITAVDAAGNESPASEIIDSPADPIFDMAN